MRKRYYLLFVISIFILFTALAGFHVLSRHISNDDPTYSIEESLYKQAFLRSGCKFKQLNINGWAKINTGSSDVYHLKEMAERAARFFALKDPLDICFSQKNGTYMAGFNGIDQEGRILSVNFVSHALDTHMSNVNDDYASQIFVVVDVIDKNDAGSIQYIYDQIDGYFKLLKAQPSISTVFTGSFPGRLANDDRNNICNDIFKRLKASKLDGIEYEHNLLSETGFSPLLSDVLYTEKGLMNLNVAMRYNSYEDCTYLWVGTPVISVEY